MEDISQIIAKNLIQLRTSAGLTQYELAGKLNYSDKSISKWERGLAIPDVIVLKQLADLYGIKVDDFFNEGEELKKIDLTQGGKVAKRLMVSLLSVGLVWLVATLCFVVLLWLQIPRAWLSFVVAIPVSAIVSIVFSCMWGRPWVTAIMVSVLVWTIALSVHLFFTGQWQVSYIYYAYLFKCL